MTPPDRSAAVDGKKGLNLRLFSHILDDRGYRSLNKADKPAILRWLREPKRGEWFAAIADTGQKHVIPWTPVNVAAHGGVVRFEERSLSLPNNDDGWAVVDAAIALLSLGVTKAEIQVGDYSVRSYQQHASAVREFEAAFAGLRGGAWFDLVVWLAQRDEEKYAAREQQARGAAKQDSKRGAGDAKAVPSKRRKQSEALAADPRPDADVGKDKRVSSRVADEDAASSPTERAEQLSLFGDRAAKRRS